MQLASLVSCLRIGYLPRTMQILLSQASKSLHSECAFRAAQDLS